MRWLRRLGGRLRASVFEDVATIRQALLALLIASAGSLVAGLTLGAITHTLEEFPGLLVLIPAAIGMRGNIFGALGSRLGTAIHAGDFRLSRRPDTVVGQNVLASMALTVGISLALAVLAKTIAVAFGISRTMSIVDFVVISVVGGAISSVIVLLITLGVAGASARYGWDLDNVAAPLVTAAGDIVTLPALYLATFFVGVRWVSPTVAAVVTVLSLVGLGSAMRSGLPILRRIIRESLPVLVVAGAVDVVAGITIERRLEAFAALPALLAIIPAFLEAGGALGGILSSRLGTKLHLGLIEPLAVPQRPARMDFVLTFLFAVPTFLVVGLIAQAAAVTFNLASPGLADMTLVALLGGFMTTCFTIVVAYGGSVATFRLGWDPDNHGIPMVTSSVDLLGSLSLVLAMVLLGIA